MIRKIKGKIVPVLVMSAVLASHAMAQTTTFDPSTATDSLEGGITTAVAIVGPLVALAAGIMVWKKVKGFFGKAG